MFLCCMDLVALSRESAKSFVLNGDIFPFLLLRRLLELKLISPSYFKVNPSSPPEPSILYDMKIPPTPDNSRHTRVPPSPVSISPQELSTNDRPFLSIESSSSTPVSAHRKLLRKAEDKEAFFIFLRIWLGCVLPDHESLALVFIEAGFSSVADLRRLRPLDLVNMGLELRDAKHLARAVSNLSSCEGQE